MAHTLGKYDCKYISNVLLKKKKERTKTRNVKCRMILGAILTDYLNNIADNNGMFTYGYRDPDTVYIRRLIVQIWLGCRK